MKQLNTCLVCNNKFLELYKDMGLQPLVNNLKDFPVDRNVEFPLVVNACHICTHKQLSIAVDRNLLFDNYLYKTGVSRDHHNFFVEFVWDNFGKKRVLDIGCNDGILLNLFLLGGSKCVGIEPSKIEVENKEIKVIRDYFPTRRVRGKFDCIIAFNVFAHNDNPKEFLLEMAKLLTDDGSIHILTTPARLDNFYHEHISYFTPQSMVVLTNICDLELVKFSTVSMHGGSYLFEVKKRRILKHSPPPEISHPYVAYGASASEIVLFNYYKLNPEYVVDDNALKQGKFIPGINSPIVGAYHLAKDSRNLTIIVAHHLFDEITKKIKKIRPKMKDKLVRLI